MLDILSSPLPCCIYFELDTASSVYFACVCRAQVFTGMPGGALPGQAGQKVMANFDCLSAPSLKVSSSGSSAKKGGASGRKTDKSAKEAGAEAAQLVNEQIVYALGKQQSGVGGKRSGGNGGTRSAKKQCNALTT
jgi:hypothetical protein